MRRTWAPGEVATVAIIAADRRQARQVLRYIVGALRDVEMLAELIEDEGAESVSLTNRVAIQVHTASFRVTLGYTFAAVLADETAFWRSENTLNPDTEIIAALRPGLSTIPGAVLLMASSPYAKRGILYDAYRRHFGKDGSRVLVWKGATQEMNAALDPAIVQEAVEDDPEAAAAEYFAEFRDDIASFLAREVLDAAVQTGRFELPPGPCKYVAFVDPSGGGQDAMTLAVAHREGDRMRPVAVLDMVREVRPPFQPSEVVASFASDLRRYGCREVQGDAYAGEWPREQFRLHGIDYKRAERSKSDIYRECLPLLNSGRVELLDVPRLVTQFAGLERRTSRGTGRDVIDHMPGAHDDIANAAAGALLAAVGGGMSSTLDRWLALGGRGGAPRGNIGEERREGDPPRFWERPRFPRIGGR